MITCRLVRSYGFALADIFIQWLSLMLECAVHRGNLANLADKITQCFTHLIFVEHDLAGVDDLALCICGRGGLSKFHQRTIGFVRIKQASRKFGGFAETNGKQARCQRIKRASVPRLLCLKQATHFLQCGVGTELQRLVEQQDAVQWAHVAYHQRAFQEDGL